MNEQKKQRLIEKYRYCNVEDSYWTDFHVDEFVKKLAAVGFFVRKNDNGKPRVWLDDDAYGNIYAVVGDAIVGVGADHERAEDFRKFFAALRSRYPQTFKADLPPAGAAYLQEVISSVSVDHSDYSSRWHTSLSFTGWTVYEDTAMDIAYIFDWDFDEDAGVCDFRASALAALLETNGWTVGNVEDAAKELVADICAEVAKGAMADYEYLTSDEVVWETIEANEWHLDDDEEEEEEDYEDEELDC